MKACARVVMACLLTLDVGCADDNVQSGDEQDVTESKPILLKGTIVTPDTVFDGQVLVEKGMITCAEPGSACAARPAAQSAKVVDTRGSLRRA